MRKVCYFKEYTALMSGTVVRKGDKLNIIYVSATWENGVRDPSSVVLIVRVTRPDSPVFYVRSSLEDFARRCAAGGSIASVDNGAGPCLNYVVSSGVISGGEPLKLKDGDDLLTGLSLTVDEWETCDDSVSVIFAADKDMGREPGRGTSYRQLKILRNKAINDF